jgi:Rod binding domain-containing protein
MTVVDAALSANTGANELSEAQRKKADPAEEAKLKKAAGDFESILLASLWKGMKQSFGAPESEDSEPAQGTLSDWGIEVMSGAVGKAGGLGIGKLILQHLEPTIAGSAGPATVSAAGIETGKPDKAK